MPVSTDRHSGFSISKWELNYLQCRYKAHRNKIAAAKPAIDANPPTQRPHVNYKKKKALQEERRQMQVVQENFRLLDRTINIMASTDMPTHFSNAVPALRTKHSDDPDGITGAVKSDRDLVSSSGRESSRKNPSVSQPKRKCSQQQQGEKWKRASNRKYFDRPLTAKLKRNTHIIFHWFIQRFGRYVPWWAEINY